MGEKTLVRSAKEPYLLMSKSDTEPKKRKNDLKLSMDNICLQHGKETLLCISFCINYH